MRFRLGSQANEPHAWIKWNFSLWNWKRSAKGLCKRRWERKACTAIAIRLPQMWTWWRLTGSAGAIQAKVVRCDQPTWPVLIDQKPINWISGNRPMSQPVKAMFYYMVRSMDQKGINVKVFEIIPFLLPAYMPDGVYLHHEVIQSTYTEVPRKNPKRIFRDWFHPKFNRTGQGAKNQGQLYFYAPTFEGAEFYKGDDCEVYILNVARSISLTWELKKNRALLTRTIEMFIEQDEALAKVCSSTFCQIPKWSVCSAPQPLRTW